MISSRFLIQAILGLCLSVLSAQAATSSYRFSGTDGSVNFVGEVTFDPNVAHTDGYQDGSGAYWNYPVISATATVKDVNGNTLSQKSYSSGSNSDTAFIQMYHFGSQSYFYVGFNGTNYQAYFYVYGTNTTSLLSGSVPSYTPGNFGSYEYNAGTYYSGSVTLLESISGNNSQEIAQLQAQLAAAQAQVAALQAQLAVANQDNSNLSVELNTANANVAGLTAQLSAAQAQVSSLQGEVSTLTSDKAALQGQVASLNGTVSGLNTQLTQKTQEIGSLQASIAGLTADKAALQASLATSQSSLGSANAANSALTATNAALTAQIANLQAQIAALIAQRDALQLQVASLQASLAAANAQIASLTAALAAAQASNATLTANLAAQTSSSTATSAQLTSLSNALGSAFGDSTFTISGATAAQQLQALNAAINSLNHGQQQALYKNLGGTKK
jgi:predicted  nucleic acid-binding Zn-ribbon protein